MHPFDEELTDEEIEELRRRLSDLAVMLTGDPDAVAECSYCHGPVPLGEALFTMNFTGVLAHVRCPQEDLDRALAAAGLNPDFDLESFDRELRKRLARPAPQEVSGEIVVPVEPSQEERPAQGDS